MSNAERVWSFVLSAASIAVVPVALGQAPQRSGWHREHYDIVAVVRAERGVPSTGVPCDDRSLIGHARMLDVDVRRVIEGGPAFPMRLELSFTGCVAFPHEVPLRFRILRRYHVDRRTGEVDRDGFHARAIDRCLDAECVQSERLFGER
jgi:hypothetical protein